MKPSPYFITLKVIMVSLLALWSTIIRYAMHGTTVNLVGHLGAVPTVL